MSPKKEWVTITIDGKAVQAPKGENLLKILKRERAGVPYYCYHAALSVAGACRMCMVEIEKAPRPVIACDTTVSEGMVVKTKTETIKEIRKWNLAFHLINHPLDCPICDQAGECGLQKYYMRHGKYNSDMFEQRVLKRKVISIGKYVMLDTERCILCSRCVRFFDEVTQTSEMAIFNRGDRSEIGTYEDKELNNNYTLNSVDICPVGALTSKDFRFKKRVWFLKSFDSICPGCSTGCNVRIDEDPREKRAFRMLPRYNEDVNGYWMCDTGRMRYKQTHIENRIVSPMIKAEAGLRPTDWQEAYQQLSGLWKINPAEMAVLITPQYTTEELESIYAFFNKALKTPHIFHCVDGKTASDPAVTDELLLRKDRNPNSQGLLSVSRSFHLDQQDFLSFKKALNSQNWKALVVFGPEDPESYPDFLSWMDDLPQGLSKKVLIGTQASQATEQFDLVLPALSFVEKEGHFVNFQKRSQKISAGVKLVDQAKPLSEILCL